MISAFLLAWFSQISRHDRALSMHPPLIGQRSRHAIAPFRLHRPDTVDAAAGLAAALGSQAAFLAGGLDLVSRMKQGQAPRDLIHLGRVAGLKQMRASGPALVLGAGLSHREAASSAALRAHCPTLAAAWRGIAHPRVQCRGTLGGNLRAGPGAYDLAPMLLALDATASVCGADLMQSEVALSALPETPGLLVSVTLGGGPQRTLRVDRSLRPMVSAALGLDTAEGFVISARLAVGCAYREAVVWPLPLPRPLSMRELAQGAAALAADAAQQLPEPLHDGLASSAYRRRMIVVLLQRLLQQEHAA